MLLSKCECQTPRKIFRLVQNEGATILEEILTFKVVVFLTERFAVKFTVNVNFVPRDQVFLTFFFYCLVLRHKNEQIHQFFPSELSWTVFICSFTFLRNSQLNLTFTVRRKRDLKSLKDLVSYDAMRFDITLLSHAKIYYTPYFGRRITQPEKTADIWRRSHWFPSEKTSEKRAQKFHTDDDWLK